MWFKENTHISKYNHPVPGCVLCVFLYNPALPLDSYPGHSLHTGSIIIYIIYMIDGPLLNFLPFFLSLIFFLISLRKYLTLRYLCYPRIIFSSPQIFSSRTPCPPESIPVLCSKSLLFFFFFAFTVS